MRLVVLCALMMLAIPSQAHRQHFAWTTIKVLEDTIEITHRFHEHDAARLLQSQSDLPVSMVDLKQQAKFALYVAEHFSLATKRQLLSIELLGAELDGPYLLVYQQVTRPEAVNSLEAIASPLMELFADQTHYINVEVGESRQTLEFKKNSKPIAFAIPALKQNQLTNN